METFSKFAALVVVGTVISFLFSLIMALPVMWLWNWVMPDLFGLHQVDFWHAWGLSFLCSLLFKGSSSSSSSSS